MTEPAQAQIVIRERVEVHPDRTVASAPVQGASSAGGPIVGYYVYYPGPSSGTPYAIREGSDGVLEGPLTVTTSTGAVHTSDIGEGFVPDGATTTYNCTEGPYTKRLHAFDDEVGLLHVPVVEGETVTSATVEVVGQTFTFVGDFSPGPVPVGVQNNCSHFESWPAEMKRAAFSIWRVFEPPPPPDTLRVEAAPDSLGLGEAATLMVTARDSLDNEVGLDPQAPVTLTIPANPWGELVYNGTQGDQVVVPYSDARSGAVSFVTDAQAPLPAQDTTLAVTATGGGLSGVVEIGILVCSGLPGQRTECETGSLEVSVTPGTLEYFEKGVVTVTVQNGPAIGVDEDTMIRLSLDEGGARYVGFDDSSALLPAGRFDEYSDSYALMSSGTYSLFYTRGRTPEADTTITVTAEKAEDPSVNAETQVTLLACGLEVCEPGNDEPQTVNPETDFPVVRKGETFTWTAPDGTPQSTVVPDLHCSSPEASGNHAGITGPANSFDNGTFDFIEAAGLSACRSADGGVVARVENLQVPIFSDTCRTDQFVADLGELTYQDFSALFPPGDPENPSRYKRVELDLEYWTIGPYTILNPDRIDGILQARVDSWQDQRRRAGLDPYSPIYFSSVGIMLHEGRHVEMRRQLIEREFNEALSTIHDQHSAFACEGDAVEALRRAMEGSISAVEGALSDLLRWEKELPADRVARPFHEGLKQRLQTHRSTAGW